jgi:hypothetical protein
VREHFASFDIESLEVLAGGLPPRQLRQVRRWARKRRPELHANWDRVKSGKPHIAIKPLDFKRWDWRGVFAPLENPDYFAQVRLDPEIHTIAWPNGADIAPETLHQWALHGEPPSWAWIVA